MAWKQAALHYFLTVPFRFQRRITLAMRCSIALLRKMVIPKKTGTVKITVKGRWCSGIKRGHVWSAAALYLHSTTLSRTSPGAPEQQRTDFNGKWQPTEGCRMRLLSKRLSWLIFLVPGAFCITFSRDEKVMKERLEENESEWLRLRTAVEYNG